MPAETLPSRLHHNPSSPLSDIVLCMHRATIDVTSCDKGLEQAGRAAVLVPAVHAARPVSCETTARARPDSRCTTHQGRSPIDGEGRNNAHSKVPRAVACEVSEAVDITRESSFRLSDADSAAHSPRAAIQLAHAKWRWIVQWKLLW